MEKSYQQISDNIVRHDRVAKQYNKRHPEIYNEFEQSRLQDVIKALLGKVPSEPSILDYGAGTGNLTFQFLSHGCEVTALDVSKKSLQEIKDRYVGKKEKLHLEWFDGITTNLPDNSFDIVTTYSVLHHIPDYLNGVEEMIRLTKKGGYIYIDHEANKYKRSPPSELEEFYSRKNTLINKIRKIISSGEYLTLDFWYGMYMRTFIDKRYRNEGDIHVFKDDHIDREQVKNLFERKDCKIVSEVDYLMYDPFTGKELYSKYSDKVTDTKLVIAKKF